MTIEYQIECPECFPYALLFHSPKKADKMASATLAAITQLLVDEGVEFHAFVDENDNVLCIHFESDEALSIVVSLFEKHGIPVIDTAAPVN